MRLRTLATAAALCGILSPFPAALADEPPGSLQSTEAECVSRIQTISADVRRTTVVSVVLAVVGAVAAALGSAGAGFGRNQHKRILAIVGVLGASIGVLSKYFDPKDAQDRLLRADRHRDFGKKVAVQLPQIDSDVRNNGAKYAAARFVECASLSPSPDVPPLPNADLMASDRSYVGEAVGEAAISGTGRSIRIDAARDVTIKRAEKKK